MHGFKNHDEIKVNPVTEYTSDMNILLVYFKICDDVSDEQKLSKKGLKLICKKTAEKNPNNNQTFS